MTGLSYSVVCVIPYLALSGADPEALARGEGDGEARRAEASGPRTETGVRLLERGAASLLLHQLEGLGDKRYSSLTGSGRC